MGDLIGIGVNDGAFIGKTTAPVAVVRHITKGRHGNVLCGSHGGKCGQREQACDQT